MKIRMNKFKKSEDSETINRLMRNVDEEVNAYFREMLRNNYEKVSITDTNSKKCGLCKKVFSDRPFENIGADGESLLIKIELFGEEITLCRNCSSNLYQWLNQYELNKKQ